MGKYGHLMTPCQLWRLCGMKWKMTENGTFERMWEEVIEDRII